jgi:NAD dependent epimerase/dehydratase family enzyme
VLCSCLGPFGDGKQWMSWIHLDDLQRLIAFAINNEHVSGPLNGTAPHPVTNSEFAKSLGSVLRFVLFSICELYPFCFCDLFSSFTYSFLFYSFLPFSFFFPFFSLHTRSSFLFLILRRPALIPLFPFQLKLMFGSQLADELFLNGVRVLPSVAEKNGFQFLYPVITDAWKEILLVEKKFLE